MAPSLLPPHTKLHTSIAAPSSHAPVLHPRTQLYSTLTNASDNIPPHSCSSLTFFNRKKPARGPQLTFFSQTLTVFSASRKSIGRAEEYAARAPLVLVRASLRLPLRRAYEYTPRRYTGHLRTLLPPCWGCITKVTLQSSSTAVQYIYNCADVGPIT